MERQMASPRPVPSRLVEKKSLGQCFNVSPIQTGTHVGYLDRDPTRWLAQKGGRTERGAHVNLLFARVPRHRITRIAQ